MLRTLLVVVLAIAVSGCFGNTSTDPFPYDARNKGPLDSMFGDLAVHDPWNVTLHVWFRSNATIRSEGVRLDIYIAGNGTDNLTGRSGIANITPLEVVG